MEVDGEASDSDMEIRSIDSTLCGRCQNRFTTTGEGVPLGLPCGDTCCSRCVREIDECHVCQKPIGDGPHPHNKMVTGLITIAMQAAAAREQEILPSRSIVNEVDLGDELVGDVNNLTSLELFALASAKREREKAMMLEELSEQQTRVLSLVDELQVELKEAEDSIIAAKAMASDIRQELREKMDQLAELRKQMRNEGVEESDGSGSSLPVSHEAPPHKKHWKTVEREQREAREREAREREARKRATASSSSGIASAPIIVGDEDDDDDSRSCGRRKRAKTDRDGPIAATAAAIHDDSGGSDVEDDDDEEEMEDEEGMEEMSVGMQKWQGGSGIRHRAAGYRQRSETAKPLLARPVGRPRIHPLSPPDPLVHTSPGEEDDEEIQGGNDTLLHELRGEHALDGDSLAPVVGPPRGGGRPDVTVVHQRVMWRCEDVTKAPDGLRKPGPGGTLNGAPGSLLIPSHGIIRGVVGRSVLVQWFTASMPGKLHLTSPKFLYALYQDEIDFDRERYYPLVN